MEAMKLSLLEGEIAGLERTSQVCGGGSTNINTTHMAIFNLQGERVLLKSNHPPMIANGDRLRVVGMRQPGQFVAVACRNITTGWTTSFQSQGCAIAALVAVFLVGLGLAWTSILFLFFPVLAGLAAIFLIRANARLKMAQAMLNR